jgi:hypothetical protein
MVFSPKRDEAPITFRPGLKFIAFVSAFVSAYWKVFGDARDDDGGNAPIALD